MKVNRSVPSSAVIPVLVYPDVQAATDWIVSAFGFRERLRVGDGHRNQLTYGNGALIVAEPGSDRRATTENPPTNSIMVRIDDARRHCEHARAAGAVIGSEPADMEFGERQYNAIDPWGHYWTFTESIADKAPEDWGGRSIDLD